MAKVKKQKNVDLVEYREDSGYDKDYTWHGFFNEFSKSNKTDIDENFQSPPRWLVSDKYRYLKSASKGFTKSNCIVVYDVNAGLEYCKRNNLIIDVNYLEDWKAREVKYLVIDGNNKRWTIVGYIGNKLSMSFNLKYCGQIYEVRNKTFDECKNDPELFQVASWMSNLKIRVIFFTNISLSECGEMFIEINKGGVKLNAQEERNSSYAFTAVEIRGMKDYYIEKIQKRFTNSSYKNMRDRRGLDEAIAKCFLSGFSELKKFGKKSLDNMYEKNLLATDTGKFNVYKKLIGDALEIYSQTTLKDSPGEILHIFNLLYLLNKSGYRLNYQYASLYKDFGRWYSEFVVRYEKTLVGRHNDQDGTLSWLKSLAHKNTISLISGFTYDKFLDDDSTNLLYKVENTSKRIPSRYERYQAWLAQQHTEIDPITKESIRVSRCPKSGKVIPFEEIYEASKWSGDHIERFVDGGTKIQLIDYEEHIKKTSEENKQAREFGVVSTLTDIVSV